MRIIYIDIDSLRPDHMGCYGYHRNTTPNIDKIASEGAKFTGCYAASSPCVPSRASFMSSRFGINHGALTHWGPGSEFRYPEGDGHSETVPFFTRYLRNAAYKTVTFSSFGDRHHAWWYFAGWNEVHTHTLKEGNENGDEVNEAVIPWLKQHGQEDNYFLHIQYWDPHTLYTYPKEYHEQWKDSPISSFPSEEDISNHQKDVHPRSASYLHWSDEFPETMPEAIRNRKDYKHLIDGYDGGIYYMDKQIGKIIETLKELGIYDDVCFVISADHGESMGEQGIYMEHSSATEAVHHIPLIMKIPHVTKSGSEYNDFVYNVDVISTITDLVGLDIPAGWDGKTFLPLLYGNDYESREYLILDHALYVCQRAVRDDRWYFIRTYHNGLFNFDELILYDLHNDPNQIKNVAAENLDIVSKMDFRLNNWLQEQMNRPAFTQDPMQSVIETGPFKYMTAEDWMQRLISEGEQDAAEQLRLTYL